MEFEDRDGKRLCWEQPRRVFHTGLGNGAWGGRIGRRQGGEGLEIGGAGGGPEDRDMGRKGKRETKVTMTPPSPHQLENRPLLDWGLVPHPLTHIALEEGGSGARHS